jgi:hypothetical protein
MDAHLRQHEMTPEPLDVVEQVVAAEEFTYERTADGEVHFTAPGERLSHQAWFAWSGPIETLHICLSVETRSPIRDRAKACDLIALLNERLWLGHFDIWSEDGAIVYRNAIALPGGVLPAPGQVAALIAAAVEAGERFYPAYNYMVWAGKTAQEAVSAAMFETAGEA